jgi:G3E family GTPase
VWVVTGALGAGKTTAIARLMANKPPSENWIVILNEFTESGIDALTVAGSAQGLYDVRLVPGGCLCCAGELDFARQLRELTRVSRPDRLIIEPSGIGHPAAITEELMQHQSYGSLTVESIVCAIEPWRVRDLLASSESVERAQVEVADVLLLSKADLAGDAERADFAMLAAALYPPKRWCGEMRDGVVPPEALAATSERVARSFARPATHARQHDHHHDDNGHGHDHEHASGGDAVSEPTRLGAFAASRAKARHVGRAAVAWTVDRDAVFARTRLFALLTADDAAAPLAGVERFKGVFRTGPETWLLVQRAGGEMTSVESSWRRDNRAEILFRADATPDVAAIEAAFVAALAQPTAPTAAQGGAR